MSAVGFGHTVEPEWRAEPHMRTRELAAQLQAELMHTQYTGPCDTMRALVRMQCTHSPRPRCAPRY